MRHKEPDLEMPKEKLKFLKQAAWSGENIEEMARVEIYDMYLQKWKYQDIFGAIEGDELEFFYGT